VSLSLYLLLASVAEPAHFLCCSGSSSSSGSCSDHFPQQNVAAPPTPAPLHCTECLLLKSWLCATVYSRYRSRSRVKIFTWSRSPINMMQFRNTAYWILIGVAIFVSKWTISDIKYPCFAYSSISNCKLTPETKRT
jgi:hypothetical protein